MPTAARNRREATAWSTGVAIAIVAAFLAQAAVDLLLAPRLAGAVIVPFEPAALDGPTLAEKLGLMAGFGAFSIVGAFLVAKRPRHPVSWMIGSVGFLTSVFFTLDTYGAWLQTTGREVDALARFGFWGQGWYWYLVISIVFVFVPLTLPDGRLPSPRWRAPAAIPTLAVAVMVVAGMLQPTMAANSINGPAIDNPIGVAGIGDVEGEFGWTFFGIVFGLLLSVVAVTVRFRRSQGAERQQLKAFLFGVALLPLLALGDYIPLLDSALLFGLALSAIPLSVGVAVLRYRLYDIDRVITRTVSYLVVTAVLVGVYAAGVLGIGSLLPGERSDLLVAGTTLVVAALFRPIASRVRAVVDRRFNRARYDANALVADFGRRLRDQVDLDDVLRELRETAVVALQPAIISVAPLRRAG